MEAKGKGHMRTFWVGSAPAPRPPPTFESPPRAADPARRPASMDMDSQSRPRQRSGGPAEPGPDLARLASSAAGLAGRSALSDCPARPADGAARAAAAAARAARAAAAKAGGPAESEPGPDSAAGPASDGGGARPVSGPAVVRV